MTKFDYGEILGKGRVVHEYDPKRVLNKYFFKKYGVLIEAKDEKEAKDVIKVMFEKVVK